MGHDGLYEIFVTRGAAALKQALIEEYGHLDWYSQVIRFAAVISLARARNYELPS
jgi:hypothetical protein